MEVLSAVERVNERQKRVLFDKLTKRFGSDLTGRKIALWGLAFKPETDDMREATSLVLIDRILSAGGTVTAYDPVAMETCRTRIGDRIRYAKEMYEAAVDADALILVTEWKEFRLPHGRSSSASCAPRCFSTDATFTTRKNSPARGSNTTASEDSLSGRKADGNERNKKIPGDSLSGNFS